MGYAVEALDTERDETVGRIVADNLSAATYAARTLLQLHRKTDVSVVVTWDGQEDVHE